MTALNQTIKRVEPWASRNTKYTYIQLNYYALYCDMNHSVKLMNSLHIEYIQTIFLSLASVARLHSYTN